MWRADLSLLGLAVPPGSSRIELVYAPARVCVGLVISGVTLGLIVVLAIYHRRRPAVG